MRLSACQNPIAGKFSLDIYNITVKPPIPPMTFRYFSQKGLSCFPWFYRVRKQCGESGSPIGKGVDQNNLHMRLASF